MKDNLVPIFRDDPITAQLQAWRRAADSLRAAVDAQDDPGHRGQEEGGFPLDQRGRISEMAHLLNTFVEAAGDPNRDPDTMSRAELVQRVRDLEKQLATFRSAKGAKESASSPRRLALTLVEDERGGRNDDRDLDPDQDDVFARMRNKPHGPLREARRDEDTLEALEADDLPEHVYAMKQKQIREATIDRQLDRAPFRLREKLADELERLDTSRIATHTDHFLGAFDPKLGRVDPRGLGVPENY
jgi:hypothetical protein